MTSWLRRIFGGQPAARPVPATAHSGEPFLVNLYDDNLVVHRPDGRREELPWDALQRVIVRVSNRAPWAGQTWLILAGDPGRNEGCVVPHDAVNYGLLLARLQAMPGFDQHKLDNATRDAAAGKSRSDAILWKRAPASTRAEATHEPANPSGETPGSSSENPSEGPSGDAGNDGKPPRP